MPETAQPLLADLMALNADCFDEYTVTALLESRGVRDTDAERYGAADVFALGKRLFPQLADPGKEDPGPADPAPKLRTALRSFSFRFATGLAFLVLAASQIVTFALSGYSLWAWKGFTPSQATIVALALFGSLLAVAPAVQAIARRGNYCLADGNTYLLQKEMQRLTVLGMICVGVLGLAIELPHRLLSNTGFGQGFGYYLLLSLFWLGAARLEVCKLRWVLAPVAFLGTMAVVLLHQRAGWQVVPAQFVLLSTVDVALLLIAEVRLRRWAARAEAPHRRIRLLPLRALLVRVWPSCAYGVVYYIFLFADHVVNWTASPLPRGSWIAFRGSYEASHDVALLVLFLCLSTLEYTVKAFADTFFRGAAATAAPDHRRFARAVRSHYLRQFALLVAVSAIAILAGYGLLEFLAAHGGSMRPVFSGPTVQRDYLMAATGYVVLSGALLSGVFLQSLSRQAVLVQWLLAGILVDVVTGVVATHLYGQAWSALGLLTGALTFASLSALYSLQTFRRGGYYLAASLA